MPPSKNISFDELSKYFHLPINQVAKELGVCATILKKICRRNGIPRWPHRKIKSLDKMIGNLNMNFSKNPQEREDIHKEIELLRTKKLEILKNPDILAKGQSGEYTAVRHKAPKLHHKGPYGKRIPFNIDGEHGLSLNDDSLEDAERMGAAVLSCFAPIVPSSSPAPQQQQQSVPTPSSSSSSVSIASLVSPNTPSTPNKLVPIAFSPMNQQHHSSSSYNNNNNNTTPSPTIFNNNNPTSIHLSLPPPPSGRPTGNSTVLVSTCRIDNTTPVPNALGLNFIAPMYNSASLPAFKYDRHNIAAPISRSTLPVLEPTLPSMNMGVPMPNSGMNDFTGLPSWFQEEKSRVSSVVIMNQ